LKSQLQLKKALITTLLAFISVITFAQTGKISGKVSDKKTGETLIGVSVKVKGTTKGMSTDVDGKYSLTGLANGKYTLLFQYIGYNGKEISEVDVTAGKNTVFDVILEEAGQKLKEVVIQGSFKKESVNALYAQQKNSAVISDGISSESIKRSPDKNTSDVLKRVSGATIQDNKFVVIRGLSDRYNTAMLDGASLPSTEPNRKAFSFDIVPSNLVENLIVSKTATPDLPGDFTGGAIQIQTKDIPDQNFISIGAGLGYNSIATFNNFQSGPRNASDFFGFDNGTRKLSSSFPSRNKIEGNTGLTAEKQLAAIKTLPQDWNIYNNNALPSQNYQFTIGRVKDFESNNRKLGAIASITYRNSQTVNQDLYRHYNTYNYNDNQYKFSTNLGALANLAYNYGNSKITLKNIYNRTFDDQFLYREGTFSDNTLYKYYAFDLMQKSLFKSTLEGTHKLGEGNSKINWSLAYSNVVNDQPDQRKMGYTKGLSDPESAPYNAAISSGSKENARLFTRLDENIYSGGVNYTMPVNMFSKSSTLKVGGTSQYRSRDFASRFITLSIDPTKFPEVYQAIGQRPIQYLFSKSIINSGVYKLNDLALLTDTYNGTSLISAGYAMLDNKIGEKFRIVWGARAEQFNLDLKTADPTLAPITRNELKVLPSANLTYSLTDKSNLRASYSRSLARPEFREIAPSQYYDYEFSSSYSGNPSLKSSDIDNFDIRYEIYPQAGQIFSVSGFYKKFTNAIEGVLDDGISLPNTSYFNSPKANVYGVELEIRKSLDFAGSADLLKNTTVYSNVTLVKSVVTNPTNRPYVDKERQMVGQAPYVINAGIQSAFLDKKLSFNALYNKIGRRIYKASGILYPNIWEAPRDVVDLQLGYKVLKNKGELKFNASDILNNNIVFYWDRDLSKKYEANGADETISRVKPGSNYSLSFSYTF
jgi:TonB-dependent receptor